MGPHESCQFVLERINVPDSITLDKLEHTYTCGRAKDNEIVCLSLTVSRRHCIFFRSENELYVTDLKSANGLFINGVSQEPFQTTKLHPNDVIGVGCPETDVTDTAMFVYKLRAVFQPQPVDSNHNASALSETVLNVGNPTPSTSDDKFDALVKRKREQRSYDMQGTPSKIPKLDDSKLEETLPKGKHKAIDENDIEIVHVSLKNNVLKQNSNNYNNIAKNIKSNDKISTGKHIDSDKLGISNNARDTKPFESSIVCKIESDEDLGSKEMQSCVSNSVNNSIKRKENSDVVNKNTERLNKNTFQGAKTSQEKNHSNGKNIKSPVSSYNSHNVQSDSRMGSSSAKVAASAERITCDLKQSLKQYDKSSDNLSKVGNDTMKLPLPPNFVQAEDAVIKMEDELQITDTEEEANCNSSSMNSFPIISPIKLKKVQQEPKTKFSEVDVVNLSDSESDIFPCSQLFDIDFGMDKSVKEEIKEEPIEAENERFNRLDDDLVISLSDSEDEDNTWLHRLSRSQLLNENDETDVKKEVMDVEIIDIEDTARALEMVVDKSSTGAEDKVEEEKKTETCMNEEEKETDMYTNEEEKETEMYTNEEEKDTEMHTNEEEKETETCMNEEEKETDACMNGELEEEEEDASLQDARNANIMHLLNSSIEGMKINFQNHAANLVDFSSDNTISSKKCSLSPKNRMLPSKEREAENHVDAVVSGTVEEGTTLSKKKKSLEKKIPQIEPPHLPVRRRSRSSTRAEAAPEKSTKRFTANERKELKEKAKLEQYSRAKEEKTRKILHKWADCLPTTSKVKAGTFLTKEEKKELANSRKLKLKKLAMEEKRLSSESNDQGKKRIVTKPKAKVSTKTRFDFLVEDTLSASKPEETTEKSKAASKRLTVANNTSPSLKAAGQTENKDASKGIPSSSKSSSTFANLSSLGRIPKKRNESKETPAAQPTLLEDATLAKAMKEVLDIGKKEAELKNKARTESSTSVRTESHPRKSNIKSSTQKPKKRVSFSTTIKTVHEYEIDETNILRKLQGKDAPIPSAKSPKKNQEITGNTKVNEFLLCIFSWNPVWLEEQQHLDSIPPVVRENDLHVMLTHYKSYSEYCSITAPLLLLETWSGITKEFQNIKQDFRRPTLMSSIVENSIQLNMVAPNIYMTNLMLEVLVTREDLQRRAHPAFGDLVFFEYIKNHEKGQTFHKVFAYVTQMYQTPLTPTTRYNKDLQHYVKDPHTVITYTMITKPLELNIPVNRVQRLRGVTYLRANLRMVQALDYLPKSPLVNLILNPKVDMYHLPVASPSEALVTKDKLNQRQLEAVFKVTQAIVQKQPKLCFIQGPPGTGKSKVIVNIVTQVLYGNQRYTNNGAPLKILVCAPSNAAIDEITLRLLHIRSTIKHNRFKMVRIGRADVIHPSVKDISSAELARRDVKKTLISSSNIPLDSVEEEKSHLESKMNALKCEMSNTSNLDEVYKKHLQMKLADIAAKYELLKHRCPLNEINPKEKIRMQRAAENRVLDHADVITCTLSSCYNNSMESIFVPTKNSISVCIVDEATQSCEAETLIPLMLGVNTLVLVGDPNQLPATVLNTRAKQLGLDQSIFSRVQNAFEFNPNNPIMMLDTQYRMPHEIAYFPNKFFYGGRLKNAAMHNNEFPFHTYRILNIKTSQNNDNFSNTDEARFVANMLFAMLTASNLDNWECMSFGILTPYNNQKSVIQQKIHEVTSSLPENIRKKIQFDVNTVDGFQGQERDVIIMSCVRSQRIGFLSDKQRLCVALTRAKHSLILCGNFNVFMRDPMWNALLSDARKRRVYFTVRANAEPQEIKVRVVKRTKKKITIHM